MSKRGIIGTIVSAAILAVAGGSAFAAGRATKAKDVDENDIDRELTALDEEPDEEEKEDETEE